MKITIIAVGKIKEKYIKLGIDEFSKRLSRFTNLAIIEVRDEATVEGPSQREIEMIQNKEAGLILNKIKDSMYVVAMDLKGETMTSANLATKIENITTYGHSHIAFVIGGSFGLSESVKKRANFKLSFSKMTFPHQLFRLMLLEQIYRAFKINANESYHK